MLIEALAAASYERHSVGPTDPADGKVRARKTNDNDGNAVTAIARLDHRISGNGRGLKSQNPDAIRRKVLDVDVTAPTGTEGIPSHGGLTMTGQSSTRWNVI